jgi:thiol-disulfide isomerase/thioredoxin
MIFMNNKAKLGIVAGGVVVVAALLVYAYVSGFSGQNLSGFDNLPVNASTYQQLGAIAANTSLAQQVGQGAAGSTLTNINATRIIINGKPAVIYVGAEYCPYCAAGRWSLTIALMRFGSFTGLQYMTSDPSDVFAGTPTFTFLNATYTSSYITFVPTELTNNTGSPLQPLVGISNTTYHTYDTTGIPFLDFANKSVSSGIGFSPSLISKENWGQILQQMHTPNSTIGQAIIGQANIFTAEICSVDNFTPASVCDAQYINRILQQQ